MSIQWISAQVEEVNRLQVVCGISIILESRTEWIKTIRHRVGCSILACSQIDDYLDGEMKALVGICRLIQSVTFFTFQKDLRILISNSKFHQTIENEKSHFVVSIFNFHIGSDLMNTTFKCKCMYGWMNQLAAAVIPHAHTHISYSIERIPKWTLFGNEIVPFFIRMDGCSCVGDCWVGCPFNIIWRKRQMLLSFPCK